MLCCYPMSVQQIHQARIQQKFEYARYRMQTDSIKKVTFYLKGSEISRPRNIVSCDGA